MMHAVTLQHSQCGSVSYTATMYFRSLEVVYCLMVLECTHTFILLHAPNYESVRREVEHHQATPGRVCCLIVSRMKQDSDLGRYRSRNTMS